MHPYGIELLAQARVADLIGEADRARAVPTRLWAGPWRRGLGVFERIGRRVDRRRIRDVAI